jgi:hypothetical protein
MSKICTFKIEEEKVRVTDYSLMVSDSAASAVLDFVVGWAVPR